MAIPGVSESLTGGIQLDSIQKMALKRRPYEKGAPERIMLEPEVLGFDALRPYHMEISALPALVTSRVYHIVSDSGV